MTTKSNTSSMSTDGRNIPPLGRFPDIKRFIISTLALSAVFSWPLVQLAAFAIQSSLYSHMLLIPAVTLGLSWSARLRFVPGQVGMCSIWAAVPVAGAIGLGVWFVAASGWDWMIQDRLALAAAVFNLLLWALALRQLSRTSIRILAFPLAFLVFMIPLPAGVTSALQGMLQHGSAAAADLFFRISGIPYLFDDLTFELPGIALRVAPECSGIHSTLVLLITSVLAAHLFLRSRTRQVLLVGAVIPLALLRNGFRIFVIGQLCVRVSPEMIHSWIHRHGGPVFFAVSLIPLAILLYFLTKQERFPKRSAETEEAAEASASTHL